MSYQQIINRGPIENQATETPERGRSSTTSQFDCIAPSANDEAGSEHNASNGSSREPEQSSSEMSLRFENLSMIENTTPVRNINNHCSQDLPASSVRTSVSNFSKVMYEPQDLIKFSIGNVPWKLACQRHENNFVVIVVCEWNEPNHSCIAFIKVRILSHFDESYFLEEDVTLQWDDQQKNCYFQFKMLDLTTSTNGYIENDTILIKLDHSIIETIGIPTPGAYHLSPEYELVVGNMTHTFPIVSIMRENDILQSESVIIGGYPWRLAMNPEGVYIFCNHAATFLFWSCKAKIEFRVINGSTKKHGVFENCRENVCSGTKWIQRSKVEIGKRDERTQTLFA